MLLKGEDKHIWSRSLTNEFGRLAQGIGKDRPHTQQIKGTDTIAFIHRSQIPTAAKVTYANFITDIRPHKKETHRVRMTVGGDKLDYHADPSAPAVGLLDTKIHLNTTIKLKSKLLLLVSLN
jgi:hypothetical protein